MNTLFKPTSYKKGAALAVGATFVWKTISFANALLLALYFGADRQTDVYFYLIMLLGFGVTFLQRLNQTVLIPEAMFLMQENEIKSRRFTNMWLYIYMGIGEVISLTGLLGAEPVWRLLSRFGGPILAQDRVLLTCGFFLFGLQIITYYLIAVAEMYKFFKTAWLGVLNAVCPLLCLLLLGPKVGIISMIYGFLLANILQIIVLLILLRTQLNWRFTPAWVRVRVQTRQNMITGQTLAILDMFTSWLPLYLMSAMGAGLVSALNYCKQFTDSTTEVFTSRIANVAKIEMTQQTAASQKSAFDQTFQNNIYGLAAILAPLVVFSCYFAPQIVELFFKRGHFDMQAVHDTVCFLRPMLGVLLLGTVGYLQNSAIAAERKIKEWFPYALTSASILILLMLFFIPRYGAFSYPYILGVGLAIGFVLNAFLFKKYFAFINYIRPFWHLLRLTALAGISLIPAGLLAGQIPTICWLQILVCGFVFVTIYILLLKWTKDLQKLRELVRNGF
ncbi:MAG: hypothetical protein J6Q05_05630 [Elusimicrobiaceae bacterium]|nr:hypothetical protein [Elusimicrobiaceae bacterium]